MHFHDIKDYYHIATGSCGYQYPSQIWKHSLIGIPHPETAWLWALWGEHCLLRGKHNELRKKLKKNIILFYYYAYSLYLHGFFYKAATILRHFLKIAPRHKEGVYLYSDCLYRIDKKKEAFLALCNQEILKKRKTWIKLSNLVENNKDFFQLYKLYTECIHHSIITFDDVIILENIAMGAQRAGEYKLAEQIWHIIVGIRKKITHHVKVRINQVFAQEALTALISATKNVGLDVFLISGTLLGIIRSGTFLLHDTDLDLGIFDGFDQKCLKQAIYTAGCFSVMPQRSPHCLRVRHINGTPIDIFTHYRDKNDFWHGGVKVSWHNTPFALKKIQFKGLPVLIPENPETYLEENYGKDWKLPKRKFDSAVDCPNLKIENIYELRIHHMKNGQILSALENKDG